MIKSRPVSGILPPSFNIGSDILKEYNIVVYLLRSNKYLKYKKYGSTETFFSKIKIKNIKMKHEKECRSTVPIEDLQGFSLN